jgi:hypothetical protein
MQTHHHHIGEINPAPCAWTKQRQVEVLDNRAFSENRLRERLRIIFSRYVSCYANLKLTTLWPFQTSKNENIKLASTCRSVHSLQSPYKNDPNLEANSLSRRWVGLLRSRRSMPTQE